MSHPNGPVRSQPPGDVNPMARNSESPLSSAVKHASRRSDAPGPGAGKVVAVSFLIGLLAGLLGLAPWLLTGARLPLQNLWGTQVLPAQMPLALLPLSQYEATTLVALMTTGGAAAGLAVRLWSPARRRLAMWCAAGGVILVQVTAAIQAFTVVGEGLAPGPMSSLYLAGLQGGVVAAVVAGLVVLLLLAAKSRALATLGVGLVAVPFVSWVAAEVAYAAGVGNVPLLLTMLWPWLPAVLVGGALAWCGLHPRVRALVWVVDLGLLWVVPAMFTAVQSVLGTRVLGGDLQEMAAMGKRVFAAALGSAGGAGPTILLALAIALVGAFARFPPRKPSEPGRADHGH
ncbi:hypothetical protein [Arthrobacter sp. TB 26]|uniref:hypothetical protein n=1 Tax=Arthrobacter sp. TB 26 TaxID=494420 RepID=UPI00178C68A7|nr:hypothetical protein [Arthrobacter sp. TB 26]